MIVAFILFVLSKINTKNISFIYVLHNKIRDDDYKKNVIEIIFVKRLMVTQKNKQR